MALEIIQEAIPITDRSSSWGGAYMDWTFRRTTCQYKVQHYAAETYCSKCTAYTAQLDACHRAEKARPLERRKMQVEPRRN